jgi:hypothetical protein
VNQLYGAIMKKENWEISGLDAVPTAFAQQPTSSFKMPVNSSTQKTFWNRFPHCHSRYASSMR